MPRPTPPTFETDTASRILDTAERLVQTRGFNGFSYADIAKELGLTKASLHYHFAGKAALGEELITRYTERFSAALAAIDDTRVDAPAKLAAYAELYAAVLRGERMCLCGMLAAELDTLSDGMRDAIVAFFDVNETWLERVLTAGRAERSLAFEGTPLATARAVISGLEGAMLVARPYRDAGRFDASARRLLTALSPVAA